MSKLDHKLEAYADAREQVLEARRGVVAIDVEIESARQHLAELERLKAERVAAARTAVRRFVELANELPPLIHSEVAGIAGRLEEPKQDEAAQ